MADRRFGLFQPRTTLLISNAYSPTQSRCSFLFSYSGFTKDVQVRPTCAIKHLYICIYAFGTFFHLEYCTLYRLLSTTPLSLFSSVFFSRFHLPAAQLLRNEGQLFWAHVCLEYLQIANCRGWQGPRSACLHRQGAAAQFSF